MGTLVTVELPSVTGLKKDSVTNSFAILHNEPLGDTARDGLATAVTNFYNAVPTGDAASLGSNISAEISRAASACQIRQYDITGKLGGAPHGSPVKQTPFTLVAASGTSGALPGEVAIVATLEGIGRSEAQVESNGGLTRPMQRRTGRIYYGPLTVPTAAATTYPVRPASAVTQRLRRAFDDLADAVAALGVDPPETPGGIWVSLGVWSRADATIYPVQHVSTDDAFDTQRRRGVAATSRTRLEVRTAVQLGIGA